ncbi:MAG TPA: CDP-alcohol phosphatidyltransferase family protein [Prolixibacteraceae bacterium]|nr:CDP-alcohol phosphatidyltransferase family protein [Prolixibacteraceae bacterium]
MNKTDAVRIHKSVLSTPEKKLLAWIARRLPASITSDHMTALGLFGSVLSGTGYVLTNWGKGFLWLASFGFIVNWFGDSLDGTLARIRNKQRPIYGFYLDHNIDALTTLIIALGAGISPFVSLDVALLVMAGYFMLSIFTYINTYLEGKFTITYNGFGPTEFRIGVILVNTLFFFLPTKNPPIALFNMSIKLFDLISLVVALILIVIYVIGFLTSLKKYSRIDPPK